MKKLNLSAVMAAAALFVACTDQAYNLGRIDTTVGTHVNIKLPVGSIGQIKFGDLLDFGEDNEILKTGEDGTYRLVMEGYSETFSIEVPDISIGPMSGYAEDEVLLPAILHGESLAPDYTLVEKDVAVPCNLDFEKVIDNAFLRGIGLAVFKDTGFSCKFTVSTGKATLKAGATMTFPDYMELEAVDDNLTVTDGHIVTFAKDCISGQDIRLRCKSMDLRKLPEGQGVISMGDKQKLVMKAQVMLRGKVVARSGDFSPIPEKIHFNYLYEFSKAEIESIQLKCDLKGLVDDIPIDIEDTGKKFNEEGYRFDLANPCITLSVTNNSPVGISMSADVHCSAGGENYCSFSFSPDKMNFPAGTATDAFLSPKGTNHAAPAIDIVDTQMSGMFKKFPEMVEIADINITTDKEYFTVTPDMKLEFKVKAGIDTEVEFGPELKIPYNMVIDGFDFTSGDDIKCQVDEAKITFDIINSIPASITLDADATRLEGEDTYVPCDDIRLQVNGSVASGTLVNPSTNHIELVFSMDSLAVLESVERITLNIVVEGNGSASEPLNMNQGIKVENIKAFVNGKVEGTL
ncbi:MAG: hypothetical protein KBT44_05415 [Bacteroidales bacterium]|nr:hypothetical protein [Candidatus Equibacterium intestinale]